MNVPTNFESLTERLPKATSVRERLEKSKRETAFLRKLLKLALQAERVERPLAKEAPSCT
jgi:hypothetical protein